MDFHKIFTSVENYIRPHALSVIFLSIGMILLVSGLISLLSTSGGSKPMVFEDQNGLSDKDNHQQSLSITIDVEGAVVKPGVYTLSGDVRIKDALIAAMGLSSDADRSWVAKNINLAAKLIDGAKVYIPSKSQNSNVKTQSSAGEGINISTQAQVNINTASVSQLDSLIGIGVVTAQKIIDNRPYSDIAELINKKIVGSSVFEKIKDKIAVY